MPIGLFDEHIEKDTLDSVKPLIWWQLGDVCPEIMFACETMSKLVCKSSKLKSDHYDFKNGRVNQQYCDLCNDFAIENVEHLLMHCKALERERRIMLNEIANLENQHGASILKPACNILHILLGKVPVNVEPTVMLYFFKLVAVNVQKMYSIMLKGRVGIG